MGPAKRQRRSDAEEPAKAPIPIIVDTDPGVDDVMAIALAFTSPEEVDVIGLTTMYGNVRTPMATTNALHLLELADRADVPVAQGALGPIRGGVKERIADFVHGSDGLGNTGVPSPNGTKHAKSAAEFIVDQANVRPGEVVLVALAGLTNVALALHLDPELKTKLKKVVILGGAFTCNGNVNPAAEANIFSDPEAADLVFGSGLPIDVVGLDVTTKCILTGKQLKELGASESRFGKYTESICEFYRAYHVKSYGLDGVYLHDPAAMVMVFREELFEFKSGAVRVEVAEGVMRGKTLLDEGEKKWVGSNPWMDRPKVRVALRCDTERVTEEIFARLARS
mmetsp:Transcript_16998/g.55606  ORF Transcript_16998/g.55606 Transcript_16998/m.55606 type:complete len:338 (+) Transcript_16998:43-1056(+)